MSKMIKALKAETNVKFTENGGLAHKSTLVPVLDLYALGGAYRNRSESDIISLFQKALRDNETYALRCLFYLRDVRGGQGERRFFRTVLHWLGDNHPEVVRRNMEHISDMGRYDDYYALVDTKMEAEMFAFLKKQLGIDLQCKTPSLMAKWLKSENASSKETKKLGTKTRLAFGLSHKQYRVILSTLRTRINVLEKLMSAGEWEKIEFDKIPSKAGFKYRNAFARRDLIAKKYEKFITASDTKVNAKTLFVHEIVGETLKKVGYNGYAGNSMERAVLNKYWEDLPNYFGEGKTGSILCMADTSGSMKDYSNINAPINASIALAMYCAERLEGPFKNHFITFSDTPQLVELTGIDFVDKVCRIKTINANTNLEAAFDLVLNSAIAQGLKQEDLPETILVLSDMEIDAATKTYGWSKYSINHWTKENALTMMEAMRVKWAAAGYKMPKLVYWNLDARQDTILDLGVKDVSYLSGFSQSTFKTLLSGKTGIDLMLEVLDSDRYKKIS